MARMILETLGLLTVIASIVMVVLARGAIHETPAIAWVGGWLMFAASVIIGRMDAAKKI